MEERKTSSTGRTQSVLEKAALWFWKIARRKLEWLDSAGSLEDLRVPPGNRLEALKGNRRGQHSIRINDQYRVCFTWTDAGPTDVEITDYHE